MWSPDRRHLLLGLAALSGCGFTPVYGPGGAIRLRGTTQITTPDTVAGFRLRSRLEERLGPAQATRFALTVSLEISTDNVAISEDGDITRITLPGIARYQLTGDAEPITGEVQSFTSYSTTGTTVATQAAAEDAEARLAVILADLILVRLTAATAP